MKQFKVEPESNVRTEKESGHPGGGDESAEQRCEPASPENGY